MASQNSINNTVTNNNFTVPAGSITSSGTITTTAGNLVTSTGLVAIPVTTSTAGQITQGGARLLHTFSNGGSQNLFVGIVSGNFTNTGSQNVGVGFDALRFLTSGSGNTGLGFAAGLAISSGTFNTVCGYACLSAGITFTGSYNIAIGYSAASSYTTSEGSNILLNNPGIVGESNVLRIGGATGIGATFINQAFICGIDGVNVGSVAKVVTMASDQLGTATITAGTNISVTPGANTITIAGTGAASFGWSVITVNQTAAVNNGYFCNKAGTLALALPAASSVGDVIEVVNINTAAGIQITQAAGQQIFFAGANTTLGATGTLTSIAVGDTLKMVCRTANLTWYVVSAIGNWTPA